MKNKFFGLFFVLALMATFLATGAVAENTTEDLVGVLYPTPADITEMTVYVDSNVVWYGRCYPLYEHIDGATVLKYKCSTYQYATPGLERGEEMSVKVVLKSGRDLSNVKVHTWINGYRNEIEARTGEFDMFANDMYTRTLFLQVPSDIDARESYTLYVQVEGKRDFTGVDQAVMNLNVQRDANLLELLSVDLYDHNRDSVFNPGTTMYADVVVKNRGNHKANDVYVKVSVKELGISRNVYLGDLEAYDNHYSHNNDDTGKVTVALPLPQNAESGTYTVEIEAYNSDLSSKTSETITVEKQLAKNVQVMPQVSQLDVKAGSTGQFSLLVYNMGETKENFVVEVLGTDGWSAVQINPASFALMPGESKTVQVNVDVDKDAQRMQHPFTVRVRYGNEAKQYNFVANVTNAGFDWKLFLIIAGIVLAVAVIAFLAVLLIRQGKKHEDKEAELESYY